MSAHYEESEDAGLLKVLVILWSTVLVVGGGAFYINHLLPKKNQFHVESVRNPLGPEPHQAAEAQLGEVPPDKGTDQQANR